MPGLDCDPGTCTHSGVVVDTTSGYPHHIAIEGFGEQNVAAATENRDGASLAVSVTDGGDELGVEGVARLGPVEGDDRDWTVLLDEDDGHGMARTVRIPRPCWRSSMASLTTSVSLLYAAGGWRGW